MSEEKQIEIIIDLLIEFDEMGFVPIIPCPDPEAYAIEWKEKLIKALQEYRKQSEGENVAMYPSSAFECSNCHWQDWDLLTADSAYNFCPHCGAKMKGGAE